MFGNIDDGPTLLNNAANCLRNARLERKPGLTYELIKMNFILITKFIDLMDQESTKITAHDNKAAKFSFIISNVHRSLKLIPGDYKEKVQDSNVCSIFYDLENLYEFNEKCPFPKALDTDLSREVVALLRDLLSLYTIDLGNNDDLDLKLLRDVPKRIIKFKRDSTHFQYFNYYKDQVHLNMAIKLIEFTNQIKLNKISGRYQFLSAVSQIIEHISKRMLSPRMTDYLVSDINTDALSMIRNFIVHREKDKSNKLQEIILFIAR
jgi:hypothetical protein